MMQTMSDADQELSDLTRDKLLSLRYEAEQDLMCKTEPDDTDAVQAWIDEIDAALNDCGDD